MLAACKSTAQGAHVIIVSSQMYNYSHVCMSFYLSRMLLYQPGHGVIIFLKFSTMFLQHASSR